MKNPSLSTLYGDLIKEEFAPRQSEFNFEETPSDDRVREVPDFKIEKWKGGRNFALYLNGELLAVVVYKKGAQAIIDAIKKVYGA